MLNDFDNRWTSKVANRVKTIQIKIVIQNPNLFIQKKKTKNIGTVGTK